MLSIQTGRPATLAPNGMVTSPHSLASAHLYQVWDEPHFIGHMNIDGAIYLQGNRSVAFCLAVSLRAMRV